jgi:hypothetical protein
LQRQLTGENLLGDDADRRRRQRLVGEYDVAIPRTDQRFQPVDRAADFGFAGRARVVVFGVLRAERTAAPVAPSLAEPRLEDRHGAEDRHRRRGNPVWFRRAPNIGYVISCQKSARAHSLGDQVDQSRNDHVDIVLRPDDGVEHALQGFGLLEPGDVRPQRIVLVSMIDERDMARGVDRPQDRGGDHAGEKLDL